MGVIHLWLVDWGPHGSQAVQNWVQALCACDLSGASSVRAAPKPPVTGAAVPSTPGGLWQRVLWCFPEPSSSLCPLPTINTRLRAHKKRTGLGLGREGENQSLTTRAGRLGTLSGFEAGDVWPYKDTSVFNPPLCN